MISQKMMICPWQNVRMCDNIDQRKSKSTNNQIIYIKVPFHTWSFKRMYDRWLRLVKLEGRGIRPQILWLILIYGL
ncbi:hypothetical protein JCM16418A_45810 [Paenibacillus pini]